MPIDLRRLDRRTAVVLALGGAIALVVALGIGFAARVAALRAQHATGPNWSFPSRVFSDGVPLAAGGVAPAPYLVAELSARGYTEVRGQPSQPGTYARTADGFDIVLRGFPDEVDPDGGGGPERVRVHLTADGRIAAIERLGGIAGALPPDGRHDPRLEPALVSLLFDDERMWRTWISLARVPQPVREAIVAGEDRRFYGHAGIDPRGALRALSVDVKQGGMRQGGSTITQQLARGLFLGRERTLSRKLAEVPLAIGLELLLSKHDILEMYVNSVYWGQAKGFAIGGIEQASRWYFDAPVESLGVLEGATLAAMIPAPNVLDPFERPERVLEKRNLVLRTLEDTHKLPAGEAARLAALPLDVRQGETPAERFPSYSSYVNDVLDHTLHHHAATHEGLSVFTTMDLAWQAEAESAIESGLARLDRGARDPLQGAFVALDPARCRVVAMVGGRAAAPGSYNRAWQARRQTGSAIKPIVYAAAFSSPRALTPATTVADTPRTFGRGRSAWTPHNYDGVYHAQVTLAKALERSLNVATTNVVDWIGPGEVVDVAERFGLSGLRPVPSVGLGSSEVGLIQLVAAYAAFQDEGMLRRPSPLRAVVDRTGRRVASPSDEASEAVPPAVASLMTALLENVVRYGVASPLVSTYGFARPVAGKTGTTNDFHDAWFVGFTPDVVAGVWVGYDRPRSIGRPAAHTALPLWAGAVGRMLAGFPPRGFAANTELAWADMDPWTGCLADSIAVAETTPFIRGTEPLSTCDPLFGESVYDSAYGEEDRDTAWTEPRDTLIIRDTLPEEPPPASGDEPPAEPDTVPDFEPR